MTRLGQFALAAIVLWGMASCGGEDKSSNDPYPDYAKSETGLYYKILKLGEGDSTPKPGDVITIAITYMTDSDSIFLQQQTTFALAGEPSFKGSFEEGIFTMKEGDSVAFRVPADSLFGVMMGVDRPNFVDSGSYMRVDVMLELIHHKRDLVADAKAYEQWLESADMRELNAMRKFFDAQGLTNSIKPTDGGLFFLTQEGGKKNGKHARYGKRIQIHYRGIFLDGKEFDNSYKNGEGMDFTLGAEGQVVPGLEMVLPVMTEGEKITVLLPSFLAYGKEGSSSGIVPPSTPVIYEIELIKVY